MLDPVGCQSGAEGVERVQTGDGVVMPLPKDLQEDGVRHEHLGHVGQEGKVNLVLPLHPIGLKVLLEGLVGGVDQSPLEDLVGRESGREDPALRLGVLLRI